MPLIILAVWIGLYPSPFLRRVTTSVDRVMARVNTTYPRNAMRDCASGQMASLRTGGSSSNPFATPPCDSGAVKPAATAGATSEKH